MATLVFRKHFNSLVPDEASCPEAVGWMQSVKHGEFVTIERPKKPRNIKHHRLWWGLIHKVFETQERYDNVDAMVVAIKVALGHCDTVILRTGETAFIPNSISFARMDQNEFNAFFDRTIQIIVKHVLPGVTDAELRHEIEEMVIA